MTRPGTFAAALLALVLFVAACGDDATSDAAAASSSVTTAEVGGGENAGSGDLGNLSTALSPDDCVALSMALAGALTPTGTFDSTGIDDMFQQLRAVAPADIQDDLAVMADGVGRFYSILDDENIDLTNPASFADPDVAAALERATASMGSPEFQAASGNVNGWLEMSCAGGNN